MALLSERDRFDVWAKVMRELSRIGGGLGNLTKTEVRTAVNSADQSVEDSDFFNADLPVRQRTQMTDKAKALVHREVSRARYEVL